MVYEAAFTSDKTGDQYGDGSLSSKTTLQTAHWVRRRSSAQECIQNKIAVSPEVKSASYSSRILNPLPRIQPLSAHPLPPYAQLLPHTSTSLLSFQPHSSLSFDHKPYFVQVPVAKIPPPPADIDPSSSQRPPPPPVIGRGFFPVCFTFSEFVSFNHLSAMTFQNDSVVVFTNCLRFEPSRQKYWTSPKPGYN